MREHRFTARVPHLVYADDIDLIAQQASTALIKVVAKNSLSRISKWLHKHKLNLGVGRSEAVLITDRRVFQTPKMGMDR